MIDGYKGRGRRRETVGGREVTGLNVAQASGQYNAFTTGLHSFLPLYKVLQERDKTRRRAASSLRPAVTSILRSLPARP